MPSFPAALPDCFYWECSPPTQTGRACTPGSLPAFYLSAYGVLTSTHVTIGGDARLLLDLGEYNYPHHQYMLGVYSHIVLFVVAYIASYFFSQEKDIYYLTYYEYQDRRRERKVREKTNG